MKRVILLFELDDSSDQIFIHLEKACYFRYFLSPTSTSRLGTNARFAPWNFGLFGYHIWQSQRQISLLLSTCLLLYLDLFLLPYLSPVRRAPTVPFSESPAPIAIRPS